MLSDFMERSHTVTKAQTVNEYGGTIDSYTDVAIINAGFVMKSGAEISVASSDGVKTAWTIITGTNVNLKQNDCVRRDLTGAVYRITGIDRVIPPPAEMQFRRYDAEVIK